MLLLAGCSFVNDPNCHLTGFGRLAHEYDQCRIVSRSGAGNYYIAHSILSHITKLDVSEVFVLWSGLSRIDIPLPLASADQFRSHNISVEEDCAWLHSGGWAGTWSLDKKKASTNFYDYYHSQYSALDWKFLNQQSLTKIIGCLNTLEHQKIPYKWGFIYDIYHDHSDESSLSAAVDHSEPLLKLLPWNKCISVAPYDYCKKLNLLSDDQFHPSLEGWTSWFANIENYRAI